MSNPFIDAGYTGPLSEVAFVQWVNTGGGSGRVRLWCPPKNDHDRWVTVGGILTASEAIDLTKKLEDYLRAYKALTGADS